MMQLHIAEVFYETGEIRFRYSRYLSDDSTRWIRHGLFRAYHPGGELASEGNYAEGAEYGQWRDYYPSGTVAAEGQYEMGEEVVGTWRFWAPDGTLEVDSELSENNRTGSGA